MSVASHVSEYLACSSWRAGPGSFVALMSLYESNYLRASWLAGELRSLSGVQVSHIETDCDLILTVSERTPYTTTLHLTYCFTAAADPVLLPDMPVLLPDMPVLLPDMSVRLYHDARLAEARGWAGAHQHALLRGWRSRAERELDQRWARNMMLNKWLEYCVDRGHRFQFGALSTV